MLRCCLIRVVRTVYREGVARSSSCHSTPWLMRKDDDPLHITSAFTFADRSDFTSLDTGLCSTTSTHSIRKLSTMRQSSNDADSNRP